MDAIGLKKAKLQDLLHYEQTGQSNCLPANLYLVVNTKNTICKTSSTRLSHAGLKTLARRTQNPKTKQDETSKSKSLGANQLLPEVVSTSQFPEPTFSAAYSAVNSSVLPHAA